MPYGGRAARLVSRIPANNLVKSEARFGMTKLDGQPKFSDRQRDVASGAGERSAQGGDVLDELVWQIQRSSDIRIRIEPPVDMCVERESRALVDFIIVRERS